MWYESNMIDECWHSVLQALRSTPEVDVKIKICFNYWSASTTISSG